MASVENYKKSLAEMESQIETERHQYQMDMKQIQLDLDEAERTVSQMNGERQRLSSEVSYLKEKCIHYQQQLENRDSEISRLRRGNDDCERRIENLENLLHQSNEEFMSLKTREAYLREENTVLTAEVKYRNEQCERITQENKDLAAARDKLTQLLQDVNTNMAIQNSSSAQLVQTLKDRIQEQKQELGSLQDKLHTVEKRLLECQSVDHRQWQARYTETNEELQRLRSEYSRIEAELADEKKQRIIIETKLSTSEKEMERLRALSSSEKEEQTTDQKEAVEGPFSELVDSKLKLESMASLLAERDKQIEALNNEIERTREQHSEFLQELQTQINKLTEERVSSEKYVQEIEALTGTISRMKEEAAEAERRYISEKASLESQNRSLDEELKKREEDLSKLRDEIIAQAQAIKEVESKLQEESEARSKDLENLRKAQDELQAVTQQLSESKNEISELQERLRSSDLLSQKEKAEWAAKETEYKAK